MDDGVHRWLDARDACLGKWLATYFPLLSSRSAVRPATLIGPRATKCSLHTCISYISIPKARKNRTAGAMHGSRRWKKKWLWPVGFGKGRGRKKGEAKQLSFRGFVWNRKSFPGRRPRRSANAAVETAAVGVGELLREFCWLDEYFLPQCWGGDRFDGKLSPSHKNPWGERERLFSLFARPNSNGEVLGENVTGEKDAAGRLRLARHCDMGRFQACSSLRDCCKAIQSDE
ncbi:uncharacterized protein F4807DRAFT_315539 [Annulohypoxylon truncatum]|uniref:uncharacterized protein n=1 Tax=Annulohypoxylon truncatum TaxID=327061 RepID=UPI002007D8A0|nr:uncharacterized protein F4807DRAFT_315539 [Annulohypoxylon truncatum]KAI1204884.1 hypothetical protein F4807DRAFT_315539 [Annulohypoxylon truncatum]